MTCGKPATHRIVWGMTVVYQCEDHTRKIVALGSVMGYGPVVDLYIGDETCSQEVREEVRRG